MTLDREPPDDPGGEPVAPSTTDPAAGQATVPPDAPPPPIAPPPIAPPIAPTSTAPPIAPPIAPPTSPTPTAPPIGPPEIAGAGPASPWAAAQPRRSSKRRWVAIGIVLATAGILTVAIGLGGGDDGPGASATPSASLGSSPLEQAARVQFRGLPEAERAALEAEFVALLAGRFEGKTSGQITIEVGNLATAGMTRLGDEDLVRRLELQTLTLGRVAPATCADFFRSGLEGREAGIATITRILLALEEAEAVEWYRILMAAIRAEVEDDPPARTVSDDEFDAAFNGILDGWTDADFELVANVVDDPAGASDADVCEVAHLFYDDIDKLPFADQATIALYDISP